MKEQVVQESLRDRVAIEADSIRRQTLLEGRHLIQSEAQAIVDRLYLPDSEFHRIDVVSGSLNMNLGDHSVVFEFAGIGYRTITTHELSDCGPVPLEERPWYVRPRRHAFERR